MTASKIEWTDRSDWNPIRGCTRVSPGCGGPGPHGGCYAEAMAARFSDEGMWGHSFAERTPSGPRWTGKVQVQWDRLTLPLRWQKPAKIFASSTSDWFHPELPMEEIATLTAVAVAAVHLRGHTIQILTKRADRMRAITNDQAFWDQVNAEASAHVMDYTDPLARRRGDARATLDEYGPDNPAPGIWFGVSVEDQARADERIPDLLATPAEVRFLSGEPLLGLVDLTPKADDTYQRLSEWYGPNGFDATGSQPRQDRRRGWFPRINLVICGGESGSKARPMHPDWARSLRDQCVAADVPFFFKQWGEWIDADNWLDLIERGPSKIFNGPDPWLPARPLNFSDAAILAKATGDRRLVHNSDGTTMLRVGKHAAGATLDGQEWRQFPRVPEEELRRV